MTPKHAARILLRSRQALLLGSFVLTAFWAWRYQGLFRLFAELEIRWANRYDSFFTLLFTFLTLFVASMFIGSLLTSVMRRKFSPEEWQMLLHDTTALLDTPVDWSRRVAWVAFMCLVGLPAIAFCGTGAYFLWSGYRAGPLAAVDVATIVRSAPAGRYLEVTGRARPGVVWAMTSDRPTGPSSSYGFIPLFADAGAKDARVGVVVRAFGDVAQGLMKDSATGGALHARGMLLRGVDGVVRGRLEAAGVLFEPDVFTLDTTESPADDIQFGWTLAGAGVLVQMLVLVGLWWFTRTRRPAGTRT